MPKLPENGLLQKCLHLRRYRASSSKTSGLNSTSAPASSCNPGSPASEKKHNVGCVPTDERAINRGWTALGQNPGERAVAGRVLGENGLLWLSAQHSDEVQNDRRWLTFAQEFKVADGSPCIETAVKEFSSLAGVERGKVRNFITKTAQIAKDNKEAGSAILAVDPTKGASVIWGCLQMLATAAINTDEAHDAAHHRNEIIEMKDCCAIYTHMYLEADFLPASRREDIRNLLILLYTKIIKYILSSWYYLKQSKLSHAARGLGKYEEVCHLFDSVKEAERKLKDYISIANSQLIIDINIRRDAISKQIENVLSPFQTAVGELNDIKIGANLRHTKEVLQWISGVPEGYRLQELLEKHLNGTGDWFLNHPTYFDWLNSTNQLTLWLKGRMGTGKSDVIAQAVAQHIELQNRTAEPNAFGYYFCDQTRLRTAKDLTEVGNILRCLLTQFLRSNGKKCLPIASELFQERQLDGRQLTITEVIDLVINCTEQAISATIIIDGLDECPLSVRSTLLFDLKNIQSKAFCPLRILISSRNKPDIEAGIASLNEPMTIEIHSNRDLQYYIKTRVEENFVRHIFHPELHSHKSELIQKIEAKADGMFRWAESALRFLERPSLDALQTLKRLDVLPPDLEALYLVIYHDLEKQSPENFHIVQKTLSIIIAQRVELSSIEIFQAATGSKERSDDYLRMKRLTEICADFVEFNTFTGTLSLSHASVYDFLGGLAEFRAGILHANVADICLDSLAASLPYPLIKIKGGSFPAYAICNLVWHISEADIKPRTGTTLISKLFALEKKSGSQMDLAKWFGRIASLCLDCLSASEDESSDPAYSNCPHSLDVMVGSLGGDSDRTTRYTVEGQNFDSPKPDSWSYTMRTRSSGSVARRHLRPTRSFSHEDSLSSLITIGSGSSRSEANSDHTSSKPTECFQSENTDFQETPLSYFPWGYPDGTFTSDETTAASIEIADDFSSILRDWTVSERCAERRIVQFVRNRSADIIYVNYKPQVTEIPPANSISISCVWWQEMDTGFISATDIIDLVEYVLATRLTSKERIRIRSCLHAFLFRKTVSKPDSKERAFWRKLAGFTKGKVHILDDEIEIIPCSKFEHAVKQIMPAYAGAVFTPDVDEGRIVFLRDHGQEVSNTIASDFRRGLASVHSEPSNPLFAMATWNIQDLLDNVELNDVSQWTQKNLVGQTPLVLALQNRGSLDSFVFLHSICPSPAIHATTTSGKTLLHIACEKDDYDAVRRILERGGNPNVEDNANLSPLSLATANSSRSLAELLLDFGANFKSLTEKGLTRIWLLLAGKVMADDPYHYYETMSMLKLFIKFAPAFLTTFTVHGFNLLHVASTYDNTQLANLLIAAGTDVNAKVVGSDDKSALHIAADCGATQVLKLLLECGAWETGDIKGRTPLHCAQSRSVVLALMQCRRNLDQIRGNLDSLDSFGRTELLATLARGATKAVNAILDFRPGRLEELKQSSLSRSTMWKLDAEHSDYDEATWDDIFISPYNISSLMSCVLIERGISPSVSMRAERPLDFRITKAAESSMHTQDTNVINSSSTSSRDESSSSSEILDSEWHSPYGPESEEAIREQRIEKDEETWDRNASILSREIYCLS